MQRAAHSLSLCKNKLFNSLRSLRFFPAFDLKALNREDRKEQPQSSQRKSALLRSYLPADLNTDCPIIAGGLAIPNSERTVGAMSVKAGDSAEIFRLLKRTPGTSV